MRGFLFIDSLKLAKSNLNKAGSMILFDALFIVSFFGLQNLFTYFAQSLVIEKTLMFGLILLIFTLIYYLLILLVYSLFKYILLDFIKSLFEKTEFSFKRLGQFYSLNIIISGIFFAIIIMFNFLLASIKQTYAPYVFIVMAIPYFIILYLTINISHSLFYEGFSIKEAINKGFKLIFTKIKIYRATIFMLILSALLLWLIFIGSGYLISLLASKNYSLYLSSYGYMKHISIVIFYVVFYFVILINRISFYNICRKNITPKVWGFL